MSQRSALIVGGGLVGTSIALGLKQSGWQVAIEDIDEKNQSLARDLVKNSVDIEDPSLIVIATPPEAILNELLRLSAEHTQATFIDISGLKSELILKVEEFPEIVMRFVGSHPMAGRENSGPQNARGDLFQGRAWILTPTSLSSEASIARAKEVVSDLGAIPYIMNAQEHDETIAKISHLPQMLSSLLGASLLGSKEDSLTLAGQGLRDISRLAASDPKLWSALLISNRDENLANLQQVQSLMESLMNGLTQGSAEVVEEILTMGVNGKKLIPGKHGAKNRDYTFLPIVIDDKPGQLARIFNECQVVNVNVEDLAIEHTPGQQTGLITLSLSDEDAKKLQAHLNANGWLAHAPRKN